MLSVEDNFLYRFVTGKYGDDWFNFRKTENLLAFVEINKIIAF